MQHLSNPLNKYLVKLVNKEAEQMYPIVRQPLPKFTKVEVKKDNVGWLNFTLTTLKELKP